MEEKPLLNRECLLKKFPGKGGWTYAEVPEIAPDPSNPFGWVQVRGSIDHYAIGPYKLMPEPIVTERADGSNDVVVFAPTATARGA